MTTDSESRALDRQWDAKQDRIAKTKELLMFDHILNWKLLKGSHDFPGPDGGTCLNEAAIIAAGFEYKKVSSFLDCPPCFSPIFSAYAIAVNDAMPDDLRQRLLMPFVNRLSGTADAPEIERQRGEFLLIGLIRDVVSIPLEGELADECRSVTSISECIAVVNKISALDLDVALALALAVAVALDLAAALHAPVASPAAALAAALHAPLVASPAAGLHAALSALSALALKIFTAATGLLDQAMRIGKQATTDDAEVVKRRLEAVRGMMACPQLIAEEACAKRLEDSE